MLSPLRHHGFSWLFRHGLNSVLLESSVSCACFGSSNSHATHKAFKSWPRQAPLAATSLGCYCSVSWSSRCFFRHFSSFLSLTYQALALRASHILCGGLWSPSPPWATETCRLKALLEGMLLFFANWRVGICVLGSVGGLRVMVVSRNLLTLCHGRPGSWGQCAQCWGW